MAQEHPSPDLTRPYESAEEGAGVVIAGRYKLLEKIGEGGMGEVWVAEQTQPVRRKVALKLIKAGMDSKSVQARFEAERQALAVMDHPSIAKVLDGGRTEAGRPFFVMEYVKGVPITQYCDAARLSVPERLALFVPVCQAVQHAHQKGIIHRDLKPSNILICLYDGKPVPKVIDFGLAKAMHQPLAEHTVFTAHGVMMGTPLYMSPEQAEFNNLDIDTRSDLYSLGVILYELLTGTTPLDRARLKGGAWQEMVRLIKDEEPLKPSTRLGGSATLPAVAALRNLEPARLPRLLRGELDWIVMKCLEKERSRRYETANGLARDLERYLADEPVEACPPGVGYRLRKLFRRHKGPVIAAGLVMLALLLGIAGMTWGLLEARRQRDVADRALQDEAEQRKLAQDNATAAKRNESEALKQKREAEQQAAIAKAVNDFLQTDLIREASPDAQPNRDITLRQVLDRASDQIGGRFEGQPRTEFAIREAIAAAYESLSETARAQGHLSRALELARTEYGGDDFRTLRVMHRLAFALRDLRRYAEAEPLYQAVLEARRRLLGPDDADTVATLSQLGWLWLEQGRRDEAETALRAALESRRRTLGNAHLDTLVSMTTLRAVYLRSGNSAKASELEQEVLRTAPALLKSMSKDNHRAIAFLGSLTNQLRRQGKLDEAYSLGVDTLANARRVLGEGHATTWMITKSHAETVMARAKRGSSEWEDADRYFQDAISRLESQAVRAQFLPARRETLAWICHFHGIFLEAKPERRADAVRTLHRTVEHWNQLAIDFPASREIRDSRLSSLGRLVQLYEAMDKKEEAATWRKELELRTKELDR